MTDDDPIAALKSALGEAARSDGFAGVSAAGLASTYGNGAAMISQSWSA